MKLRVKVLAAAAGIALAGAAQAAFNPWDGNDNQSELFLLTVDQSDNIQGFFDLGVNITDFTPASQSAPGTTRTWNLVSGQTTGLGGVTGDWSTAWNAFSTAANATPGGVRYMVGALEGDTSDLAVGDIKAVTTSRDGLAQVSTQDDGAMQNYGSSLAFFLANAALGNLSSATNGGGTTNSANGNAWGFTGFLPNWQGNAPFSALADAGQSAEVFFIEAAFNFGLSQVTQFAGSNPFGPASFTLSSDGVLTYAVPVPEADTWVFMLAGLGLVGLLARRRLSV